MLTFPALSVYHVYMYMISVFREEWRCSFCEKEEDVILKEPEVKEYSFVGPGKRKAPSGLTNKEIKVRSGQLKKYFCFRCLPLTLQLFIVSWVFFLNLCRIWVSQKKRQSEETWEGNVLEECLLSEFGQCLHKKECI